jgi:hypothetical protein
MKLNERTNLKAGFAKLSSRRSVEDHTPDSGLRCGGGTKLGISPSSRSGCYFLYTVGCGPVSSS